MENIINPKCYLFCDVETGGIGAEYSLLTAYFLATDDKFNKIDDLSLFLKPDDGIYRVCGEAMNVNRIDLKVHDRIASPYKEAGTKLYKWLQALTDDGKIKATIVGHNVGGDRDRICQYLISRGSWEKFTSYRLRDTQSAAGFLIDCGIIKDISGSLESLAKYFGVKVDQNDLHNAKVDTETTLKVYVALREIVINLNNKRTLNG